MDDSANDELPMFTNNNINVRKCTTRSSSLSKLVPSSYDNADAFISNPDLSHGGRSSLLVSVSSPLYIEQNPEVSGPTLGKQRSKAYAVMPKEMGQNGGGHEHLLMSGPLGLCNNPNCTVCPAAYKTKQSNYGGSLHLDAKFRLAYVAPESTVVGAGDLVSEPKKIALHYLRGYFALDLFIVLPLPQVIIVGITPYTLGLSAANDAKNLLRATVLLQYIPRFIRFIPLLAGQSASGFIFESAWANFVINLLMFVLAGHVVGSFWYLFGLQRVNQCLEDTCAQSNILPCQKFIDCGRGNNVDDFKSMHVWQDWLSYPNSSNCFIASDGSVFDYGIYQQAVLLKNKA